MKILTKLKEYIYNSLVILFILLLKISSYANGNCRQEVTVKYTPYDGVRVYSVSGSSNKILGGNDRRGVIDLGHFSGVESQKELNIGTIEVIIEMKQTETPDSGSQDEFQIVNINKLRDYVWSYNYDVTNFIGMNSTQATIKVDNYELLKKEPQNGIEMISFVCNGTHDSHAKYLRYKFDLILKLSNLHPGGMLGFSPKKIDGTSAYINIKDIVVDQLKGSAAGSSNR